MYNPHITRLLLLIAVIATATYAAPPTGRTTLSDDSIKYVVPERAYHVMRRGNIEAVVVDNRAVDDEVLPGHRAGYSGVAALRHTNRKENLFVPAYAGLNFEHIHDGTTQPRDVLFEPRRAAMELRVIDDQTIELYQAETTMWGLESAHRYHLLADGTIEMTFECIAHRKTFRNGYIGLFWASYINQPPSLDIHFRGHREDDPTAAVEWVRGITPAHGKLSTHVGVDDRRSFDHDDDFPLTLAFNRSHYRYREPWYFGVSDKMALALMFRPQDQVRLTQSPSGGGRGNPAWDFQYFIPRYEVGKRYQLVVRASYLPFRAAEQVDLATRPHRMALAGKDE